MLTRCGDDLFSIAVASPGQAQALALQLREAGAWPEVIPGIDTVLVRFNAAQHDAHEVRREIEAVLAQGIPELQESGGLLEIPVVYGGEYGPDLDALCSATGLAARRIDRVARGSRVHGGHDRVYAGLRFHRGARRVFPRAAAQGTQATCCRRFGWDRRRADRAICDGESGRLEHHRAHAIPIIRRRRRESFRVACRHASALQGD